MGALKFCGLDMADMEDMECMADMEDMEGAEEGPVPLDDGPLEDEVLEDMDDSATKGQTDLIFANATTRDINIKVKPLHLLVKKKSNEKQIGIEAGLDGVVGVNFQVGGSERDVVPWKEMLHTVAAHEVSPLPLPAEKTKLGKVSLMTNSIEILISTTNEETGEEEEVGKGYSVAPGQGIILFEHNGKIKVEAARGRRFWRKFQPWVSKYSKQSRDPHRSLMIGDECSQCGESK